MNQELEQGIEKVDLSYKKRSEKATQVWAGFDEEVAELTTIVSKEFSRVLGEMDLSEKINNVKRKVAINNFNVNYEPQWKEFAIRITGCGIDIDGKSFSDKTGRPYAYCAYDYLKQVIGFSDEINPRIMEFKKDFNVRSISYNCECGSDHK